MYQPFEDVLPYSDFSITLRVKDIPFLLDILAAVPLEQLLQYRRALREVYRAFYWVQDGLAYNYTLRSLSRKLHNLWGHHYRRRG